MTLSNKDTRPVDMSYLCSMCHEKFPTRKSLDHHDTKAHPSDNPHICSTCQGKFTTKTYLDDHVTKAHPFGCVCQERFSTKTYLDDHVAKAHPSRCVLCLKEFPTKTSLDDHVFNTHPESQKCRRCYKLFENEKSLEDHMDEKHTGKKNILIFFAVAMAPYPYVFLSDHNYTETLIISLIPLIAGFTFIFLLYKFLRQGNHKLGYLFRYFPHAVQETGDVKEEKKSRIFSNIFGFLASLAITQALSIYYRDYGKDLYPTFSSFVNIATVDLLPILQLIVFFVVAIPLTHAGYIFLSNLFLTNINQAVKMNKSSGLIAVFIISIIQVSFLFFLANALANPLANPSKIIVNQSNLFVFWLTLTMVMASVGAGLVKIIINKNRIPLEWIFLYAFTVVFLIAVSLRVFERMRLESQELNFIYLILLGVLFARSILDYYVGHYIYFPDTSDTSKKDIQTNKEPQ